MMWPAKMREAGDAKIATSKTMETSIYQQKIATCFEV